MYVFSFFFFYQFLGDPNTFCSVLLTTTLGKRQTRTWWPPRFNFFKNLAIKCISKKMHLSSFIFFHYQQHGALVDSFNYDNLIYVFFLFKLLCINFFLKILHNYLSFLPKKTKYQFKFVLYEIFLAFNILQTINCSR